MYSINISCPSTTALTHLEISPSSRTCKNRGMVCPVRPLSPQLLARRVMSGAVVHVHGSSSHRFRGQATTRASSREDHLSILDYEFPLKSDEFDLDNASEGLDSIHEAIEDIRRGKMVIVIDDENRENEGDLIMAAEFVTAEAMAFIVKHGTGIVCVSMKEEDLEKLQLPQMVHSWKNEEKLRAAFTVSVDAKYGTTTGVSAQDRATTILALASKNSKPEDFERPGHIFPLQYREGGVLNRAGHTEAAVDLAVLAGLRPVGVLCEIVDEDGSMARLPALHEFAKKENMKIISIADMVRFITRGG